MTGITYRVDGTVVLPADVPTGAAGTLELDVVQIVAEDAPARRIAHRAIRVHDLRPGTIGPYVIEGTIVDSRARHTVQVTLDLDGDGQVGIGDLLSVQSHPVRPGGQSIRVPLSVVHG